MTSTIPPLLRKLATFAVAAIAVTVGPQSSDAQLIDVSLNLHYNNVLDDQSGGTWDLSVKTDQFGLAGLTINLQGISEPDAILFLGPSGEVNIEEYAGMRLDTRNHGTYVDLAFQHDAPLAAGEQNWFYGIGSIIDPEGDGGSPNYPGKPAETTAIGPELTTLTNVENGVWGTGDFLGDVDWEHAAILASGVFAPGLTPDFYSAENTVNAGVLFTALPATAEDFGTVSSESIDVTAIVRSDLGVVSPGDFNGDGTVDMADYAVWRDTLGTTVAPPGTGADFDGSGVIDAGDYAIWRTNFGTTPAAVVAPVLAGAPVPEPQTLVLSIVLASCGVLVGASSGPRRS